MQKIYEDEQLRFLYIPEQKCLIQHWNGYVHDDNFKEANEKLLEMLPQYSIQKIISVSYDKFHVTPAMLSWSTSFIIKELMRQGLKHLAFVMSGHQLVRFAINQVISEVDSDLNIKVFHFYSQAQEWIFAQD